MFINGLVAQTRSNLSIEYIAKLDSGYNYFSIFANGKNFDTLIYVTDSKPLYITKKLRTTLPDKVYDIPIAIGTEWVYKFTSTYYYGRSIVLNTPYRYTNTIEGEMNIKVASQMLFSTNATYYCTTRVIGALFSRQYGVTETTSSVSPIDGKCLIIKNNEEIRFDGITFPNPNYSSTASLSIPLRVRGDVGDTILINSTIRIANRIGLLEYCHGWSRNYQNEAMNACLFLMSKTN
jgi:hypothetical protein